MEKNELSPIPQISEIVAFFLQNFTAQPDVKTKKAMDKAIERLRDDTPLSVEDAAKILRRYASKTVGLLDPSKQLINDLRIALQGYIEHVSEIDCGPLPSHEVRRTFDRYARSYWYMVFSLYCPLLDDQQVRTLMNDPNSAVPIAWRAFREGKSWSEALVKISTLRCSKRQETWEEQVKGWENGTEMRVSTILEIATVEREQAVALLLARAYARYCQQNLAANSAYMPAYIITIEQIQPALQSLLAGPYADLETFDPIAENSVLELLRLLDPNRRKELGDLTRARECFKAIEATPESHLRLPELHIFQGLLEVQCGNFEQAMFEFEQSATWFKWRSPHQFRTALYLILITAPALKRKQKSIFKKWRGWAEAYGLATVEFEQAGKLVENFPFPFLETKQRQTKPTMETRKSLVTVQDVMRAIMETTGDNADLPARTIINQKDKSGRTCLHLAVCLCKPTWVQKLIDAGADVEVQGKFGQTPLYDAVSMFRKYWAGSSRCPKTELQNAVGLLPTRSQASVSPFLSDEIKALLSSRPEFARFLNVLNEEFTPKFPKGASRRIVMTLLHDGGANPNTRVANEEDGLTPFLCAAEIGDPWLIETLLNEDANICDASQGANAYDRLVNFGHVDVAKCFEDRLRDTDQSNDAQPERMH
ncbi:ankyrin repeat domain-containing protein [Ruegeria faecimaris]|uniref:ankyrin repeat domain-containing protein n=1 Tax=Ruegeria faecimaris TaxID=686389 RepID=UPI0024909256|nr:ankyrin repeat domain-containing protein [Ruegeria faecimaris]